MCINVHLYTRWVVGACRGQRRALDHLELELQTVVSPHGECWELNLEPWDGQTVLLTTEPCHVSSPRKRYFSCPGESLSLGGFPIVAAIGFSAIYPYTSVLNSRGGGGKNMNALGPPPHPPALSWTSFADPIGFYCFLIASTWSHLATSSASIEEPTLCGDGYCLCLSLTRTPLHSAESSWVFQTKVFMIHN